MQALPLRHLRLWRHIGHTLVIAMLVVSLLPAPRLIGVVPQGDKLGHALAFGALMLWYGQIYAGRRDRWRLALACVAFGLLIEILQAFVPYRSADWRDLAADALGVALSVLLLRTPLGGLLSRLDARLAR